MEVKYGNLVNTSVHMQRHRVGARGNVTSFPLPWQSLLQELQRLDQHHSEQTAPDLPRVGKDLAYVVQVMLKTADSKSKPHFERLVHQVTVRRQVVVNRILEAKARQHRAYIHVDEQDVRRRAKQLPEKGVPPELLHVVPLDDHLDKQQVQNAATPVEGRKASMESTAAAFSV